MRKQAPWQAQSVHITRHEPGGAENTSNSLLVRCFERAAPRLRLVHEFTQNTAARLTSGAFLPAVVERTRERKV
jgi:hypothetical protein